VRVWAELRPGCVTMADETKDIPAPRTAADRKLGNEWSDWDGAVESQWELNEDQRVFIGFAFLALLFVLLCGGLIYYMIAPRLEGWHHLLATVVLVSLLAAGVAVLLWFCALALPLLTGRRLPWRMEPVQRSFHLLLPLVFRMGRSFGISRDRMGNSFVNLSNALVRGARINTGSGPLLVLLPHCLTPESRRGIQALAERFGALVHTVPGGEKARKLIQDHRPSRIIAVACERDLVAGLQDVAPVIPTFAVPNCRPEGPCKNTTVDLRRIEEAMILLSPSSR